MKIFLTAAGIALCAASSASALDLDFSGAVNMGLAGVSEASQAAVTPVAGLDAEARVSFEISGSVTVGIVVPVTSGGVSH